MGSNILKPKENHGCFVKPDSVVILDDTKSPRKSLSSFSTTSNNSILSQTSPTPITPKNKSVS